MQYPDPTTYFCPAFLVQANTTNYTLAPLKPYLSFTIQMLYLTMFAVFIYVFSEVLSSHMYIFTISSWAFLELSADLLRAVVNPHKCYLWPVTLTYEVTGKHLLPQP